MKKFIPLIIALALFFVSMLYNNVFVQDKANQVLVLKEELQIKENDYTVKKSSLIAENEIIIEQATGVTEQRKEKDDVVAEAFITDVVSWSSFAEYLNKKDKVSAEYVLDADFLALFFPDVLVAVAEDGTVYNYIDTYELSLSLYSFRSYVTNVNADATRYTYFAICTVASFNNGGEAYKQFPIMYTVDANGMMSDIKGIL